MTVTARVRCGTRKRAQSWPKLYLRRQANPAEAVEDAGARHERPQERSAPGSAHAAANHAEARRPATGSGR